jgi:hypothetical protein
MEISRRDALAGAAAVAAAPLLAATAGRAAAPVAEKQAPSFYRYKVGDIQGHRGVRRQIYVPAAG